MWLAEVEHSIPKGVFALIAIAFWAISTAVKSAKKQRQEQIARERLAGIQIPPPAPVQSVARPSRRGGSRRAAPVVARPKQAAQAPKRAAPPPVPLPAAELSRGTQAGRSGVKPSPPRVPNATAASVRQWLRPETLRSQFIISELFQPPKALRPPDDHSG